MSAGGFSESSTIQAALVHRLSQPDMGWEVLPADHLRREDISALVETDVRKALIDLNPLIAADHARVEQVMPALRMAVLSAVEDGLVAANQRMMNWLRGLEAVQFIGEPAPVPVRLIDFDNPRANRLVVSEEVWFQAGADKRRYDLVLWVNGFPLAVGETKTPFEKKSWLNAARDITQTYEVEQPGFFVPNVLSFASEGKELRYGPVGMPAEMWMPWGKTTEEPPPIGLARALHGAELLLSPERLLDILRTYTLFSTQRVGKTTKTLKVIPRYPQVEAVEAIAERAADPKRRQGLIWHHQGSGKTLLAAFACGKLRRAVPGSTVIVLLDRLDLIEQTGREFESAGVERVTVAETKDDLRELVSAGQRGVIITTIFRFAEAGHLTDREDVIVIADEAHRSQEGILGLDLRKALPNATYIGMTGTPIADGDHDTYETFGDPDDPEGILNAYPPERSMADGAVVPIRVEVPKLNLRLDKESLDEAFDELAEEEGLDEADKERVAKKASHTKTLLKAPKRVDAICEDIVRHYRSKVEPLGMKAQVVVYDRDLCVAYCDRLRELMGDDAAVDVVMTVGGKDDPAEYAPYRRDRQQEAAVKAKFLDFNDPLKLLVVTAKLLTGFDAPIEGVMYLDKPLRRHTLFQALTRTNRRWTNPVTGQEKTAGLIVDYIGLGKQIAEAMRVERKEGQPDPLDTDTLITELRAALTDALAPFHGIDRDEGTFKTLMPAQERIPPGDARDNFARAFLKVQALWELLWPDEGLRALRADYRWAAKLYQSVQPSETPDALLWMRLGAKTLALINEHIISVDVRGGVTDNVTVDEETIKALRELGFDPDPPTGDPEPPNAEEILDSIEKRIAKKLAGDPDNPEYKSLAERLDRLRQMQLETAADSVEFLKAILEAARDLVAADREAKEDAGEPADSSEAEGGEPAGLLPEERMEALTAIFNEYKPDATPEIIKNVVSEIDTVVSTTKYAGWQTSNEGVREVKLAIRVALNKYGLPATGELFDRAYDYVAEHY